MSKYEESYVELDPSLACVEWKDDCEPIEIYIEGEIDQKEKTRVISRPIFEMHCDPSKPSFPSLSTVKEGVSTMRQELSTF